MRTTAEVLLQWERLRLRATVAQAATMMSLSSLVTSAVMGLTVYAALSSVALLNAAFFWRHYRRAEANAWLAVCALWMEKSR